MKHFFATGYNKSGTTFLQMLLDGHPEINCPPEHHLITASKFMKQFDKHYLPVIEMFDERTARQGLRYDGDAVYNNAMRAIITTLMEQGSGPHTSLSGINDNWLFTNLPYWHSLLPQAKFVVIVRDPREAGVSLWHHLDRTEPHKTEGRTIDDFIPNVGDIWSKHINAVWNFGQKKGKGSLKVVRYEDLISERREKVLQSLLGWLEVDATEKTVEACFSLTDQAKNKGKSDKGKSFYRSGKLDTWRDEVSPASIASLEKKCEKQMKVAGYSTEYC